MSRTKINWGTDREQYTRSNAATARVFTLVKPAETLACDWPNTNDRQEIGTSTITLLNTIYKRKHQIDWDSATCITYSTDYYQPLTLESWLTNFEQTALNCSQQLLHRTKDLLTKSSKTNCERTTGQLTIWLTIHDCLNVTIEESKCTNYITSLHYQ